MDLASGGDDGMEAAYPAFQIRGTRRSVVTDADDGALGTQRRSAPGAGLPGQRRTGESQADLVECAKCVAAPVRRQPARSGLDGDPDAGESFRQRRQVGPALG
jgi:hypothetical protein